MLRLDKRYPSTNVLIKNSFFEPTLVLLMATYVISMNDFMIPRFQGFMMSLGLSVATGIGNRPVKTTFPDQPVKNIFLILSPFFDHLRRKKKQVGIVFYANKASLTILVTSTN